MDKMKEIKQHENNLLIRDHIISPMFFSVILFLKEYIRSSHDRFKLEGCSSYIEKKLVYVSVNFLSDCGLLG